MTNTIRSRKYPFEMCFNSIKSNISECLINEPAMIVMSDTGSPLKIGDKNYIDEVFESLKDKGLDLELIHFNLAYPELGFEPEGYNFTPSEICTLFNWLSVFSIGEDGWKKFKELSLDDMKEQLKSVQKMTL